MGWNDTIKITYNIIIIIIIIVVLNILLLLSSSLLGLRLSNLGIPAVLLFGCLNYFPSTFCA